MDSTIDECRLFGILRSSLRDDLVSSFGFPPPVAGSILNWFDPAKQEYLDRVDAWQVLLCRGWTDRDLPFPILKEVRKGLFMLREDIPTAQIMAVHQVAKLVYKFHGKPRKETDLQAVKKRLSEPLPITLDTSEVNGIKAILAQLELPPLDEVVGRFGPGATAEGYNAYQKWMRSGKVPDVPQSWFRVNPRDQRSWLVERQPTTKIAEVPKTIKSNRTVSSEPAMFMFAQLKAGDALSERLHSCFPKNISLHDQDRHARMLVREGCCTIDLSDASDHVSVELVKTLLPNWWTVLSSVRSTHTLFPDGEEVELSTFAPMGSGVCFPVLSAICAGIVAYAIDVTRREKRSHYKPFWGVYGDDIIVPIFAYDYTLQLLERAGLVINRLKSCCTLRYRESCGYEYFDEMQVQPVYLRDNPTHLSGATVEEIAQRLIMRGFESVANSIIELAQPIKAIRVNRKLQRWEVLVRDNLSRAKIQTLDGWDGLMRWFSLRTRQDAHNREPHVKAEVWTKLGWRFHASQDYPCLTTWFVTNGQ